MTFPRWTTWSCQPARPSFELKHRELLRSRAVKSHMTLTCLSCVSSWRDFIHSTDTCSKSIECSGLCRVHGGYQNEPDPQRIYNLTESSSLKTCSQISVLKRCGQVSSTAFECVSKPCRFSLGHQDTKMCSDHLLRNRAMFSLLNSL